MPDPILLQTLTLSVDGTPYEFQLSNAAVVPSYADDSVETFAGTYATTSESFALTVAGFQDYGSVTGFCRLLWESSPTDELDFSLDVGGDKWAGKVNARKPNAGGAAGGALDFTIDLPCVGKPTYTPKPATP